MYMATSLHSVVCQILYLTLASVYTYTNSYTLYIWKLKTENILCIRVRYIHK